MTFWISEVDGMAHAQLLNYLNGFDPTFPPLKTKHLAHGFWWFAQIEDGTVVAFAGLVPMVPFDKVGYLKRAYVLPDYRGGGLQVRFLHRRERKARELGWYKLITETGRDNWPSQRNLTQAGFKPFEPEQPWGAPDSVYFQKRLAA